MEAIHVQQPEAHDKTQCVFVALIDLQLSQDHDGESSTG